MEFFGVQKFLIVESVVGIGPQVAATYQMTIPFSVMNFDFQLNFD
jgi:hypothetical protein